MDLQVYRGRANLQEWAEQVQACRNSGMKVREWCEMNGLSVKTYYYRQRRVASALEEMAKAGNFAEVPMQSRAAEPSRGTINIQLGNASITISNGASEKTISAVMRALAGIC